jgi:hypothetical protein
MKGRLATAAAAGVTAGLALSACGGSPAAKPKLQSTWNVDTGADAVIQFTAPPNGAGPAPNFLSPYDGASIPSTTVQPDLGGYNPVCVIRFPDDITWRVYDLSAGNTIGAGAQADCNSIADASGAVESGPAS